MRYVTVQELIDDLETVMDKSLPVILEGCDCINPATTVDADSETLTEQGEWIPAVLIRAFL